MPRTEGRLKYLKSESAWSKCSCYILDENLISFTGCLTWLLFHSLRFWTLGLARTRWNQSWTSCKAKTGASVCIIGLFDLDQQIGYPRRSQTLLIIEDQAVQMIISTAYQEKAYQALHVQDAMTPLDFNRSVAIVDTFESALFWSKNLSFNLSLVFLSDLRKLSNIQSKWKISPPTTIFRTLKTNILGLRLSSHHV